MRSRHRQSGLTILGCLFVAKKIVSLALLGFRVAPSYIEYFSVQKILHQMMVDSRDGVTINELRRDFDRRTAPEYIESVRPSDLELNKDGNVITVSAAWQTTLHLFGNVSLLLDFYASASK